MAAVAITVATGGAALPVIASVALSAGMGAAMGAISAAVNGGDVFEAATDGLVDGFMWGGITAWAGAAYSAATRGPLLNGAKASINESNYISRGSTGRNIPNNINEQLGMAEAKSMPIQKWKVLDNINMTDTRWASSAGWKKVEYIAGKYTKTIIHAVYNIVLDVFDDFKFK